jgi:hypothetical protein
MKTPAGRRRTVATAASMASNPADRVVVARLLPDDWWALGSIGVFNGRRCPATTPKTAGLRRGPTRQSSGGRRSWRGDPYARRRTRSSVRRRRETTEKDPVPMQADGACRTRAAIAHRRARRFQSDVGAWSRRRCERLPLPKLHDRDDRSEERPELNLLKERGADVVRHSTDARCRVDE